MSRAETTKLYRTFVKGMITEASPLTYPEDASYDEDNMILYRKGNRSRRLGIDFEDGYVLLVLDGESAAAPGDVLPEETGSDSSETSEPDTVADQNPNAPDDLQPW